MDRLAAAVIPPSVLAGVIAVGQNDGHEVSRWFSGTGLTPAQFLAADAGPYPRVLDTLNPGMFPGEAR